MINIGSNNMECKWIKTILVVAIATTITHQSVCTGKNAISQWRLLLMAGVISGKKINNMGT